MVEAASQGGLDAFAAASPDPGQETLMRFARVGVSLVGMLAVVSALMAGATIWLLLTDPVTVAERVTEGSVSPFVRQLADVIYDALKGLLKYL